MPGVILMIAQARTRRLVTCLAMMILVIYILDDKYFTRVTYKFIFLGMLCKGYLQIHFKKNISQSIINIIACKKV